MPDSGSGGITALPDATEKTIAQSARNSGTALATLPEHPLPLPQHARATEATKDSQRDAIASENRTHQRDSQTYWEDQKMEKKKKKKKKKKKQQRQSPT